MHTASNKIANFLYIHHKRYFNVNNIMYAEAWTKISSWVKNNPPPSKVHISLIFRASDHTSFIQHDVKSGIIIRSVYVLSFSFLSAGRRMRIATYFPSAVSSSTLLGSSRRVVLLFAASTTVCTSLFRLHVRFEGHPSNFCIR